MTFDLAYFPQNVERRVTNVTPQLYGGLPIFFSGEDDVVVAGTLNSAVDNQGIRNGLSTTSTTNNVCGIKGEKIYTRAMHVDFHVKFKLNQLLSERLFIGLTSVDSIGMVSPGDSPTGNFVGLSFSTSRGDDFFMFIRNDGGVMPAAVSSGIAKDMNLHDLYIWCQDTQIVIQLDNTRIVFTTDLPNLSTPMRYDAELITLAASVKKFELGKLRVSQDD